MTNDYVVTGYRRKAGVCMCVGGPPRGSPRVPTLLVLRYYSGTPVIVILLQYLYSSLCYLYILITKFKVYRGNTIVP